MNVSTLQKSIPDTVIQPNEISQAIYSLGPYARKLLAMAMALISPEEGEYRVAFDVSEFTKAIGLESSKGGSETKKYIQSAVRECASSFIEINGPNGKWEVFPWLARGELAEVVPSGGGADRWTISIKFNPELGETIKAFKRGYSKLNLVDLGRLQSRYAIRYYELAVSYAGFEGKSGNPNGEWYFEMTLTDIRIRFGIDHTKYKITKNFRIRVVDNPIEELNTADIGIRIEPEYIRKRKYLVGVRFKCRWIKRDEPKPTQPATEAGMENEKLKDKYPEEFEKLLAETLAEERIQPKLIRISPETERILAEEEALKKLREMYPQNQMDDKRKRQYIKKG